MGNGFPPGQNYGRAGWGEGGFPSETFPWDTKTWGTVPEALEA